MKNILIPSDFSIQSLDCIESVLSRFQTEKLTIFLVHIFQASDSIYDLLFPAKNTEYDYISEGFWHRCRQLELHYPLRIQSIKPSCFYGTTSAVFKNYLDSYQIDLIAYPAQYMFKRISKTSVDPSNLIAKSGREVIVLPSVQESTSVKACCQVKNLSYSLSLN